MYIQLKLCKTATLRTEERNHRGEVNVWIARPKIKVAVVGRWSTGKAILAGLYDVRNESSSAKTRRADSASFFFSR